MKQFFLVLVNGLMINSAISQIAFEQILPIPPAPTNIADFADVTSGSIAFADIDNDDDQDMLITGDLRNPLGNSIAKLYRNDGNGNYAEVYGTPFVGVFRSSVAFADIDNDSDLDVLISGRNTNGLSTTKLYTNEGNGSYTEVTEIPFDGVQNCSIAFADIDNDNDQDVLITGQKSTLQFVAKLYLNDGNGNFTEVLDTPFEKVKNSSIAFVDIDNDNDQDVFITGRNELDQDRSRLYTNDGNGNFTEVEGTPFIGIKGSAIAFADIDNDSDPDLLITGKDNSQIFSKLYINDGYGVFEELLGTPLDGVWISSVAFADIDNDNDQDVLITGYNDSFVRIAKLYSNDGIGNFTEITETPFYGVFSSSVAFSDIDNDNDQDVIISGEHRTGVIMTKLYTNDGSGIFTEATGTPFDEVDRSSVAFADVDNDNDQDVLISGGINLDRRISKLYTNDGIGNYSEVMETPFDGVRFSSVAFADIDNDNDQDVLITGEKSINGHSISKLYANNGSGIFTEVPEAPFEWVQRGSIAFADIDNDNDQDVLITGVSNFGQLITFLYTNDGNGVFEWVSETPFEPVWESSIAFADIDNDSDLDVLITGETESDQRIAKLYTNNGNGVFTEVPETPFIGVSWSSIAFADIDNDNDQDVLISGFITGFNNSEPSTKLYTNDGDGNFTEINETPFVGVSYSSIAFSDVDNDNDQDVLITGWNKTKNEVAKLYTNDGSGLFTEFTQIPFNGVRFSSISFTDIDNDNDQDVLITGQLFSGQPSSNLYRNITIPTSIREENNIVNNVNIFPNPNTGLVNIDLGSLSDVSIKVFNINGKLVYQKENINTSIHQFNFIEAPGVYILEISAQGDTQQFKLIKEY